MFSIENVADREAAYDAVLDAQRNGALTSAQLGGAPVTLQEERVDPAEYSPAGGVTAGVDATSAPAGGDAGSAPVAAAIAGAVACVGLAAAALVVASRRRARRTVDEEAVPPGSTTGHSMGAHEFSKVGEEKSLAMHSI